MTVARLDLGDVAALAALRRAVQCIGWERTADALAASRTRSTAPRRGPGIALDGSPPPRNRRPAYPADPGDPLASRLPAVEPATGDLLDGSA